MQDTHDDDGFRLNSVKDDVGPNRPVPEPWADVRPRLSDLWELREPPLGVGDAVDQSICSRDIVGSNAEPDLVDVGLRGWRA